MVPDWAAKATAVPYADFGNPQTLNLYAIVHNNPESLADLDGHYQACGDGVTSNGPCREVKDDTNTSNPAPPAQNTNAQQASKPVPVVVVTSDTTHPAPLTPGVVERDRVYTPGTMDSNGNVVIDHSGNSNVTLTEKKTAGNDNPTNCASGCTEKGALEDQIHVSGQGKYSTFRQDFRVNNQPALIVSGKADDLIVSPAQIVHASAQRIEIDPSQ